MSIYFMKNTVKQMKNTVKQINYTNLFSGCSSNL